MEVVKNFYMKMDKIDEIISHLNMNNESLSFIYKIPIDTENFNKKTQTMIYSVGINQMIDLYKYFEEHKDTHGSLFLQEYTYFRNNGTIFEDNYPDIQSLVYQTFINYKTAFESWYSSFNV